MNERVASETTKTLSLDYCYQNVNTTFRDAKLISPKLIDTNSFVQ